jgi:hypothetical protein
MDPAEHDPRPALARQTPYLVSAQRIARVNPDSDHVPGLDRQRIEHFERLVTDDRVSELGGGGASENVQPPRGDNANAKGQMAGINQMHVH